jgi:hypothetical protein
MTEAQTASHWRSKAQDARRIADRRRGQSKDAFLEVARAYDRLAQVIEQSSAPSESNTGLVGVTLREAH